MPFSLFLYLHERFQKKHEDEFDQNNTVLSPDDIRQLLGSAKRGKALDILCSAVVDHRPVNGMSYHLRYPLSPLFYHDHFKKAMIAAGIGEELVPATRHEREIARKVLGTLTDPDANPGYVTLLAWNSLGRMLAGGTEDFAAYGSRLRRAMAGSVGSVIGALIFCDHCRDRGWSEEVAQVLTDSENLIRFRQQKILHYFYLAHCSGGTAGQFADLKQRAGKGIVRFVTQIGQGRVLAPADLSEGLVHVELFRANQERDFWDNTPHADIGRKVIAAGSQYIKVSGAYVNDLKKG